MELYIFDRNLNFKGILDNYFSLRWVRRYYKAGEFELHCALTPESLNLLARENIIYKKDDTEAGYIEYRNLTQDTEGKEILVVKGKFLTGYLDRRIIWGTEIINDTAENAMRRLVDKNCINPVDSKRKINNLILGTLNNFSDNVNYQISYGNLSEELENLSNISDLGHRINFDINNKKLIFDIFKGLDRSVNQSINPRCIFSKEFENVLEQEYVDSFNNYKNVCLVNGAYTYKQKYSVIKINDDGSTSTEEKTEDIKIAQTVTVGSSSGLDRYEQFVDGGDISSTGEDEFGNDITISPQDSLIILANKGNETLAETKEIKTFDSKINMHSNLTYKVDFDLGDIVTCVSKKWGVTMNARITEIEQIYEESGEQINVVFGNNIPTLIDKIKQKIK